MQIQNKYKMNTNLKKNKNYDIPYGFFGGLINIPINLWSFFLRSWKLLKIQMSIIIKRKRLIIIIS